MLTPGQSLFWWGDSTGQIGDSVHRGEDTVDHLKTIPSQAARKAFKTWKKTPGNKRRNLLNTLADMLEDNKQRFAEVESLDNGKPVSNARAGDVTLAIEHLRYFAGWADKCLNVGFCFLGVKVLKSGKK